MQLTSARKKLLVQGYTIDKLDPKIKRNIYKWKMVEDSVPNEEFNDYPIFGVVGFDFNKISERETPLADLFMHMYPGNWRDLLSNMNEAIKARECATFKLVSQREWFQFHAIIFVAHPYGEGGAYLVSTNVNGFERAPNVGEHGMKAWRFKQIMKYFPYSFVHPSVSEEDDKWYMISWFVEAYNKKRRETVAASRALTIDESMTAWKPRTSKTGGLPNISYIMRKPEPLGIEWKVTCCTVTGIILKLEIMRGKEGMKNSKYQSEYGATTACVVRHVEATTGCGRPANEHPMGTHKSGDSWFASVKTAEQLALQNHEYVGP